VFTPGPQGGTNWQPSSYNQKTHMFYVCAQSGVSGNTAGPATPAKKGGIVQSLIGGTLTIAGGFGKNAGTFTAIDATTGKIVWQKKWPEACYAGSATTAGNIVFIGRKQRRASGLQRDERQPALELPNRGGRERRADDLQPQRQGVRRLLRRRERAGRYAAR